MSFYILRSCKLGLIDTAGIISKKKQDLHFINKNYTDSNYSELFSHLKFILHNK